MNINTNMNMNAGILIPDWGGVVLPGVRAGVTTRVSFQKVNAPSQALQSLQPLQLLQASGLSPDTSASAYASFNVAMHVGDDPAAVKENRARLRTMLPSEPLWLNQVHGTSVVDADLACNDDTRGYAVEADASFTRQPGQVCAVMTADCLPVLLATSDGSCVAAIHAGWRGVLAGIIEATLDRLNEPPERMHVWLGPAIGPSAFEVGDEVRTLFMEQDVHAHQAFQPQGGGQGKWLCDLYLLARLRLARKGITQISGGDLCTYTDHLRFYSYRRDGATGRMVSLIWREVDAVDAVDA